MEKIRFLRILTALTLASFAVFSVSCTQKNSDGSRVVLTFDWNKGNQSSASPAAYAVAPTAQNLGRVMVNIRGEFGLIPLVWDRHGYTEAPQSTFEASVPKGNGRFIQILLVFEDPTTGSMEFYYGDATVDVQSDIVDVNIRPTAVGSATGQGMIAGRYLDNSGTGPTGKVFMEYVPPGGKPPMVVTQMEIFAGWFEFFALQGAGLNYVSESGIKILTNTTAKDANLLPTGTQSANRMRVYVPSFFENRDSTRVARGSGRYVLGYFGDGAGSREICYDSDNAASVTELYSAVTGTATYGWQPNLGAAAESYSAVGVEEVNGVRGGRGVSDPNNSSTGCAVGGKALFNDYLVFDHNSARHHGGVLGFSGPFKAVSTSTYGSEFLQSTASGSTLTLTYSWLPGVQASGYVDGVGVFVKTGYSAMSGGDPYREDSGFACNRLVRDFGFQEIKRVPVANSSTTLLASEVGLADATWASQISGGQYKVILCPFSYSRPYYDQYYNSGIDSRGSAGGGGGGGGTTTNTYELKISGPSSISAGNCSAAFTVSTYVNGTLTPTTGALAVNINFAGSGAYVYQAVDCNTGSQNSNLSIASGLSSATFYLKHTSTNFFTLQANATGYPQAMTEVANYMSGPPMGISLSGTSAMAVNGCYDLTAKLSGSGPEPRVSATDTTFTLNVTGFSATLHSTSDCSDGPLGSGIIPADNAITKFFVKPTGTTTTTGALAPAGSGLGTQVGFSVDVGSTSISNYIVEMTPGGGSTMFGENECVAAIVRARNNVNAFVNATATMSVTIGVSGGLLYESSGCGSGGAGTLTRTIGTGYNSGSYFYFRPNAGVTSITFNGMDQNSAVITGTFGLRPTSIGISGFAGGPIFGNYCYPVTVERRNSSTAPFSAPVPVDVVLNTGSSGYFFETFANCTAYTGMFGDNTTVQIASGSTSRTLYYTSYSPVNYTASAGSNIGGVTGDSRSGPLIKPKIKIDGFAPGASFTASVTPCKQVDITLWDASSNPMTSPHALTLTPTVSSFPLYTNSACTTTLSGPINFGSGFSSSVASGTNLFVNMSSMTTGGPYNWSMSLADPNFQAGGPSGSYASGTCTSDACTYNP